MRIISRLVVSAVLVCTALDAFAYPVDPAKVGVELPPEQASLVADFVLAYDSENPAIIYYAPKLGRTATLNGMPLIGFTTLPNGEGMLNAQLQYGVFGADSTRLLGAIRAAGKSPVLFPFRRTKIVPLTPGIDPATGKEICTTEEDLATGQMVTECSGTMYKELLFATKGPSLGENIAVTASLKPMGAAVYKAFLKQGNALQLNLEAEYYAAGTAFSATVKVSYEKLYTSLHTYASVKAGRWVDAQVEQFFRSETLCAGRRPEDCGVWIEFKDLTTGKTCNTATLDPDNLEQQKAVLQAAERLRQSLQDKIFTPIAPVLGPVDKSRSTIFKLDAKFEQQVQKMNATFTFTSPRGVNVGTTTLPASIGCTLIADDGAVSRFNGGDCPLYWQ